MIDYYRINVAQNGRYLFATENGEGGGGITREEEARKVTKLFREKFPASEGYSVSVVHYEARGHHIDFE